METEIVPSLPKRLELLNSTNLLQGTEDLPGIRVCLGACAAVAGRSRHPDVNAGNEGISTQKVSDWGNAFIFISGHFFHQSEFPFLSCAVGILSRCSLFFFYFSQLELKCQWMYLWGALQLFRGFEARSAADRGTLCLWRQMKRLFVCAVFRGSYRRFVFFSVFFSTATSFAYISWRVRRGLCVLGCGRRNRLFSQRLTLAVLICPARGEPVPSYSGCAWIFCCFFLTHASNIPAGCCFCPQLLIFCWLGRHSALLLRPSPLMPITAASSPLREGWGLWAPSMTSWHHDATVILQFWLCDGGGAGG